MITYVQQSAIRWDVFLDKKAVGTIWLQNHQYQYLPKGKAEGGEKFETLDDCKQSLED